MVVGCCVFCCDCTCIPFNKFDKESFEEVAERRAGVKRSETNERLPIQADVRDSVRHSTGENHSTMLTRKQT